MRKIQKSTWIPWALLIYSGVVYAYFIPRSTASTVTIVLTVAVNLVIIAVLAWLLRRKERLARERNEEMNNTNRSS